LKAMKATIRLSILAFLLGPNFGTQYYTLTADRERRSERMRSSTAMSNC